MKDTALLIAAVIFLIVSLLHFCRLIFKWEVKMGRFTIPQWASIFGFAAPMLFAIWLFSLLR